MTSAPSRPASPARILYCEQNVDGTIGGSYYSLLYLVRGLDRARFDPLVVFYTEHSLLPAYRQANVKTIVWPRPTPFTFASRLARSVPVVAWPLVAVQKALNFVKLLCIPTLQRARLLRKERIAIVHLNNSILRNHDWMIAALLTGTPCMTHERGINPSYSRVGRWLGKRLEAVICISDAVRENMRANGAGFDNLHTIHNGLDPEAMVPEKDPAALRAELGIGPRNPVVLMVGNLKAWKGQDTVVRAMAEVCREQPSARCVLVGDTSAADAGYERELRARVAEFGLDRAVVFAGFQKNVTDFLLMSDIVVHASTLPEPFGRVLLEAMACRRPVIGSRAGGVTEIVEEEKTGLTFPPGDSTLLARAILRLIENPEEAARFGTAGYDRIVREFHVDRNVEATSRLYDAILTRAR
jgi:glycosyltransferase involved in cell wall biosynthesis